MKRLIDPPVLYREPDTWMDPADPTIVEREVVVAQRSGETAFLDQGFFASVGESLQDWNERRRRNQREASR